MAIVVKVCGRETDFHFGVNKWFFVQCNKAGFLFFKEINVYMSCFFCCVEAEQENRCQMGRKWLEKSCENGVL